MAYWKIGVGVTGLGLKLSKSLENTSSIYEAHLCAIETCDQNYIEKDTRVERMYILSNP